MKNFVMSLVGLGVLFSLTACGTEVKTREYYSEHLDEAKARLQECRELKQEDKLTHDDRKDCASAQWAVEMAPDDRVPWGKGKF